MNFVHEPCAGVLLTMLKLRYDDGWVICRVVVVTEMRCQYWSAGLFAIGEVDSFLALMAQSRYLNRYIETPSSS